MNHILLSIKPKWAEHILKGTKKWEFRKKFPEVEPNTRIILYSTSPEKKIIGEFTLDQILKAHPTSLGSQTLHETPHTIDELLAYFGQSQIGVALKVGNKTRYLNPISIQELKQFIRQPPLSSLVLKPDNPNHQKLLELIERRKK